MSQTIFPYLITTVISIASGMTLWGLERLVGRRRDRRGLRAQVAILCARYEVAGRRAVDGDMPRWRNDEAGALSALVTSKEGRDALYGRDYGRLCALANSVKDHIVALEQCPEHVATVGLALVRDAHGARLLLGDHREVLDGRPLHLAVSWRSHVRKYLSVAPGALAIAFTFWVLVGRATGATGALAFYSGHDGRRRRRDLDYARQAVDAPVRACEVRGAARRDDRKLGRRRSHRRVYHAFSERASPKPPTQPNLAFA